MSHRAAVFPGVGTPNPARPTTAASAVWTPAEAAAAFDGLFDDAAIFPPGNAPMGVALRHHLTRRAGPDARFMGWFVCSLGRLAELEAELADLGGPIEVSVVVPFEGEVEAARARQGRMLLRGVELAAPPDQHGALERLEELARYRDRRPTAAYLEPASLPVDERLAERAAQLDVFLKFRTGSVDGAFLEEEDLAASIVTAVGAGAWFKCTAGLHRAVRHRGTDGREYHGFLNVLAATCEAQYGDGSAEAVAAVLAEPDAGALVGRLAASGRDALASVRGAMFTSFGTCSLDEPLADLRRLGLLAATPEA